VYKGNWTQLEPERTSYTPFSMSHRFCRTNDVISSEVMS